MAKVTKDENFDKIADLMSYGLPAEKIAELTGVSRVTVTRVARCLKAVEAEDFDSILGTSIPRAAIEWACARLGKKLPTENKQSAPVEEQTPVAPTDNTALAIVKLMELVKKNTEAIEEQTRAIDSVILAINAETEMLKSCSAGIKAEIVNTNLATYKCDEKQGNRLGKLTEVMNGCTDDLASLLEKLLDSTNGIKCNVRKGVKEIEK